MIKLYFGLPGCGKTTLLALEALRASKAIEADNKLSRIFKHYKRKCPYRHVYGNVRLEGIKHYTYIPYDYIGVYDIRDSLILIDEATIVCDSRDYKSFPRHVRDYFLLHRHYNVNIYLYTQQWDGVDKKVRVITDQVYYVYKGILTGKWFTRCYRVPYGIIIPDKKDSTEKLGEIVQGYCKPSWFTRVCSPWVFRPPIYKYYDSWEAPKLKPLPSSARRLSKPEK